MSLDILIANLRGSHLPTCETAADEIGKMRVEIAQLRADLAVSRGETDVCARAIDASEAAFAEARRVLRKVADVLDACHRVGTLSEATGSDVASLLLVSEIVALLAQEGQS